MRIALLCKTGIVTGLGITAALVASAVQAEENRARQIEEVILAAFVNNVLGDVAVLQVLRHGEGENFRQTAGVTSPRLAGLEFTYLIGAF